MAGPRLTPAQRRVLDRLDAGWIICEGRYFPRVWLHRSHREPTARINLRTFRSLLHRGRIAQSGRTSVAREYRRV